MLGRVGILLILVCLVFLPLSCARISEEPSEGEAIAIEKLSHSNAIPSNWGKLISVSHRPDFRNVFQLWFQDEEGNLRMAVYNMKTNRLLRVTRLIPQK